MLLTDQIKASKADSIILNASPDGKWVLWGEGDEWIFTASIDGASHHKWNGHGRTSKAYWLLKGGIWTQLDYQPDRAVAIQFRSKFNETLTDVMLHYVEKSSEKDQRLKVPPGLKNQDVLTVLSPECIVTRTSDQVTLKQLGPRAFNMYVHYREIQDLSVWSLDGSTPVRHFRVHLPGQVLEAVAASDGKRVAWLVQIEDKTQHSGLLQRLIRRFQPLQLYRYALYASDLNGMNLQEIGYVGVTSSDSNYPPMDLRWLPGNRYVSFLYRDRLWKVATD